MPQTAELAQQPHWDSLPNTCTLLTSELIFDKLELNDYYTQHNAPPWLSEAVIGDWTDDDLNPLFTLLDDVTPTYCQAQLAIPSFLAQCDRIGRAMAKFSAHPDTVADPFSADLARSVLTEFGLATQWAVDNYIVVIPAPPQLQRYRFELGGLGCWVTPPRHASISIVRTASASRFITPTLPY